MNLQKLNRIEKMEQKKIRQTLIRVKSLKKVLESKLDEVKTVDYKQFVKRLKQLKNSK